MQEPLSVRGEDDAVDRTISIGEAARLLGVSERTIYRMLRSGKLVRVSMSDKNVRTQVKVKASTFKLGADHGGLSDSGSLCPPEDLRRDLQHRDAQIAQLLTTQQELLATQQELTKTIQRLQDQIFELACLVVRQRPEADVAGPNVAGPKEPLPSVLRDLLRFGRRRSDRKRSE